jgi:hypothetical protein
MEQGHPSVSMGTWVKALSMLGRLEDMDQWIGPKESLFARYETPEKIKNRQRAKRKSYDDEPSENPFIKVEALFLKI